MKLTPDILKKLGKIDNQIYTQVRNQIWNQVDNQVWNQVWNQVIAAEN